MCHSGSWREQTEATTHRAGPRNPRKMLKVQGPAAAKPVPLPGSGGGEQERSGLWGREGGPPPGGCRHQGSQPWLEFWHGARRKRMETVLPTLPSAASHLYPAPATGQSQPETRGQRSLGMESLGHRVSLLPCFVSKMQPQSVLRFIQT